MSNAIAEQVEVWCASCGRHLYNTTTAHVAPGHQARACEGCEPESFAWMRKPLLSALLLTLAACGAERPAAPAAAPQDTTSELAQPHDGRMHFTVMVLDSARAGLLSEMGDTVHVVPRDSLAERVQLRDVVRRCNRKTVTWCIDHKATDGHRVRGF